MSDYTALTFAVADGVATITLERPEAMNALNLQLKEELGAACAEAAERHDVRSVLLTGSGRAFSAGGDISEMDPGRSPAATRARMDRLLQSTVRPLARLPKPVVAAVNGHCHGLGLSLMLACDIAYAARSAVFSLAFTRMGLVPDGAAIHVLPRIVGVARAKELVLTARRFPAEEALALGLVVKVVDDDALLAEAGALAASLAAGATLAYAASKRLLEQAPLVPFDEAVELEAYAQAIMMASDDHAEAVAAFRAKRTPQFRGC